MKRKFLVETNIQYLYHMNSKNPPFKAKIPLRQNEPSIHEPSQISQQNSLNPQNKKNINIKNGHKKNTFTTKEKRI